MAYIPQGMEHKSTRLAESLQGFGETHKQNAFGSFIIDILTMGGDVAILR